MVNENQCIQACPVCESTEFVQTEESFNLIDILKRWEKEARGPLHEVVWKHYTSCAIQQVTLYHCDVCGFGMFQPLVVGSQEFYSNIAAEDKYYVAKKWEFVKAIKDLKTYGIHKVLDIGCGSGYFLDLLRSSGLSIESTGYEVNPQIANLARAKGHRVYVGKFPESILTATKQASYDAVCMFQILEHISDPIGLIRDVMRLLDPKGILIVGVPDSEGPLRYFSSALTDIPPHHVSRWCESVFRIGMSRLGLRVVRKAYEPLPHYLWSSYLPVIMENDILPSIIGKIFNKTGFTKLLIQMLTCLGIRGLYGIRGHTLYVILKRE